MWCALSCVALGRAMGPKAGGAGKAKQAPPRGPVFGNGDRVLDKGVWKRFKNCQHCELVSSLAEDAVPGAHTTWTKTRKRN